MSKQGIYDNNNSVSLHFKFIVDRYENVCYIGNCKHRLLSIAYFWLRMGVLLHTHFGWQPSSTVESSESWSSLSILTDWNFKNVQCTCIIWLVHLNQFSSMVAPKICDTCLAHVYLQFTTFAHTKQTQHSCKKLKIFSVACK